MRPSRKLVLGLTLLFALPAFAEPAENPFHRFFGEWTLKNDDWKQNWGDGDEAVKIPNHYTVSNRSTRRTACCRWSTRHPRATSSGPTTR